MVPGGSPQFPGYRFPASLGPEPEPVPDRYRIMDERTRKFLVESGVMAANGRGQAVRAGTCPRCRRPIFSAWDAPRMAGWAVVDPAPLSPMGEVVARTGGIPTWDLAWAGTRYELHYRTSHHIEAHAAGTRTGTDVVAEHRCGIDIAHTVPSSLRGPAMGGASIPDIPPF